MAPGRAITRAVNAAGRAAKHASRRSKGGECQRPDALVENVQRTPSSRACADAGIRQSRQLINSRSLYLQPLAQPCSTSVSTGLRTFSAAAAELPPHEVLSMPALSPTMKQGNLAKWNMKEGDQVAAGDSICDIETDKATLAFDSQEDGFLAKILVKEGTKDVPVGTPVAVVVESADDVAAFADYKAGGAEGKAEEAQPQPPAEAKPSPQKSKKPAPKGPSKSYPPHMKLGMPALSPTMKQGNIATWQKNVGDQVAAGDNFADIETDKATMAFESQEDGYLAAILVPSGSKDIPVGKTLAILVEEKDDLPAFADYKEDDSGEEHASTSSEEEQSTGAPAAESPSPKPHKPYTERLGPSAKKLLAEAGIDPWDVKGTGPYGIITKGDALAAAAAGKKKQPSPPKAEAPKKAQETVAVKPPGADRSPGADKPVGPAGVSLPDRGAFEDIPNSNIRRIIAKRLLESKRQIPHLYLTTDTTLDAVLALRKDLKERHGVSVSVNDFVVRAAALALQAVPEANGSWDEQSGEVITHPSVDISVAVSTDKGLMTPIVKNAHQKSLSALSAEVKDLAARAREGKLKPDEFQGGTFTISNLGMFQVDHFAAIINPPQACIMAVGRGNKVVEWKDSPEGGKPVVETRLTVTLSADARVFDGEVAGRFLASFSSALADPTKLLL